MLKNILKVSGKTEIKVMEYVKQRHLKEINMNIKKYENILC
jgi:hypothetical protein